MFRVSQLITFISFATIERIGGDLEKDACKLAHHVISSTMIQPFQSNSSYSRNIEILERLAIALELTKHCSAFNLNFAQLHDFYVNYNYMDDLQTFLMILHNSSYEIQMIISHKNVV